MSLKLRRLHGSLLWSCASAALLSACGGGSSNPTDPAVTPQTPTASRLAGRSWTTGQSLESGDPTVSAYAAGIDDAGKVIVTFVKSDGTRNVLYAVHGTPGVGPTAPSWSSPRVIDAGAGGIFAPNSFNGGWNLGLAVSPDGKAYATWIVRGNCTPFTYHTLGLCYYLYGAAFDGSTWLAPELIGDTPRVAGTPIPRINSNGDIAVLHEGGVSTGAATATSHVVVASRNLGQAAFFRSVLTNWPLTNVRRLGLHVDLALDADSNLTLAGSIPLSNSVDDIMAYRGKVGAVFARQEFLETQANSARFLGLAAAPTGRSFAAWAQADSTGNIKVWASAATAATAAWTVTNTSVDALPAATYTYRLVGLPDGSGDLYLDIPAVLNDTHCSRRRWTPGAPTWTAQSLPAGCQAWDSGYAVATASNGNQLWLASGTDTWSTYDDALNQVVKVMAPPTSATATDYMLGFSNSSVLGTFNSNATILTSSSGISAVIANTGFDVLPTAPTLSSASSIDSLWAWYLK